MKRFQLMLSLLTAWSALAAEPVMRDLNFDGHPDQMILRKTTERGNEYEIRLYDPKTGSYRFDPVFSHYIAGLPPELDPAAGTIQTRFRHPGFSRPFHGYKFAVRNGVLCFSSGMPLPEKNPFPMFSGKLTPEIIDFDRKAAGAEYAELLKARKNLERQFVSAGIPFDRVSAVRFLMDGAPNDPRGFSELDALAEKMARKQPADLPCRIPDANARKRRTEYLAAIAADWKTAEFMLGSFTRRRAVWVPDRMLCSQTLSFRMYSTLSRIFAMRMQEMADAGRISDALAEFDRSRVLLDTHGPIVAGLVSTAVEAYRLNALSDLLSRGNLSSAQLEKLETDLRAEEELIRRNYRRAWYLECAWTLDIIASFIDGTADESLNGYRTPENHVVFLLAVPFMREWIFQAGKFLRFLSELPERTDYRKIRLANDVPEGFMLSSLISCDFDGPQVLQFATIARIRAARTALRHLGLKSAEIPLDPFSGKPFRVRKGRFMTDGKSVLGLRIYSAGADGRYADGVYLRPDKHCDDVGFDLIEAGSADSETTDRR